ncbi:MAG: hypothetical protein LBV72_08705 [Tannerella sp.]|jgi:hypothetical protein|nr:hypothetical protein [Tannerella sp.]
MTIAGIQGDSVYFLNNEYYTTQISDVKKLHRANFYEKEFVYGYSKEELQELYNDKMIRYIWRDLPYNTEKLKGSNIKEDTTEDEDETEEADS